MENTRGRTLLRFAPWVLVVCVSNACSNASTSTLATAPGVTPTPVPPATATPAPTPSPTPAPDQTPTPMSTSTPGPIALSVYELDFTTVGAAAAQTTMATETFYLGPYSATTTDCTGIATIAGPDTSDSFTVTPVGNGICSFTIAGASSPPATLKVTVTLTSGTVKALPGRAR